MPGKIGATSKDKKAAGEKTKKAGRGRPRWIVKPTINETEYETNLDSPGILSSKKYGTNIGAIVKINKSTFICKLFQNQAIHDSLNDQKLCAYKNSTN